MAISFTKDQQKVIDTRNKNILVSAAAGSGKTAVLVERIVKLVTNKEKPVDIDKLLIVTFTSAAASEMRERISDAFMRCIEENPTDEHIQKQMTLIHNAQITTIDSFCLFIIRNNFNDIGLDPGFRVADEAELELLRKDVLGQVLEERFEQKDPEFYHCVECYSTNGKEKNLEELILKLYQFAMSYPFPAKWLKKCKEAYEVRTLEGLLDAPWIQDLNVMTRQILKDSVEQLTEAIRICEEPDGPYMYQELLENEKEMVSKLAEFRQFKDCYQSFQNISFGRLPSKKDDSVSGEKREIVKEIRNDVKDSLQKLKMNFFEISPEQCLKDLQDSAPAAKMLIDLTIQFMEALDCEKRERNIVDFGDMEHFALSILLEEKHGSIYPTKTALGYRDYFEEILTDEYQDSNLVQEYLLQSIAKEEPGKCNRFMVGDVKQSIYKFRLARPEIFMEKYHTYQNESEDTIRIDLKQNFRSREEVIESINFIFYQIMQKNLGGIQYNEDAALYLGADYEEKEATEDADMSNQTELICVQMGEDTADKKETEAIAIAKRIRELVGHFKVTDKKSGLLRPAQYQDIVILLRSNAGWDDVFRKTLMEEGIPTYTASKTGYFSAIEIQTVLNFLRILDNPLQDIPLCAVLTTPVFGFSEEELSMIRIVARKQLLFEGLQLYTKNGDNTILKEKIEKFLSVLQKYRKLVPFTPIHELLHQFMEEVGFYYYMSALPGGEQRKANLDQLLQRAIHFEQTSYHGLFHFIRYMEQMQKYDIDMGEANIQDENADVVRIMSIHKSKGLEFPICFVAGLSKRFNMQDTKKTVVMDLDYGIGTDYVNPEERYKATTLRKNVISMKLQRDNIGEELRILYVALTRAKEKLIMIAVVDDLNKKIAHVISMLSRNEVALPYRFLMGAGSYLDDILAALIRHRAFQDLLVQFEREKNQQNPLYHMGPDINVKLWNSEDLVRDKVKETIKKEILKQNLINNISVEGSKEENPLLSLVNTRFSYVYPHKVLSRLYTKTTVSEIKKQAQIESTEAQDYGKILYQEPAEKEKDTYIPAFMREQELISGTTRGSAYHRILELLNLEQVSDTEAIRKQIMAFVEEGRISQAYMDAVRIDKLQIFLKSSLATRMKNADQKGALYREQPFVLGVAANEIDAEFPKDEMILVQGIIDVYFEEEGQIIVADYKTDRVKDGDELFRRYRKQLDYYAKALSKLRGMPVKEKIIYSFALGKEFRV